MIQKTERQEALEEAKELDLTFPKNAKLETIKAGIAEAIDNSNDGEEPDESLEDMKARLEAEYKEKLKAEVDKLSATANADMAANMSETPAMKKLKKIREATKLIRVIVTNRNPMKQSWEGEIFSVSNDMGVNVKKYIPFNEENGYHVPQIILNMLNNKKCTVFVNKKIGKEKVKVGKQIKEYGIEILPPLSEEELKELGDDQRARDALSNS